MAKPAVARTIEKVTAAGRGRASVFGLVDPASYAAQQSSGWAVLSLAWCGCGGDAEAKRTLRFGASADGGGARPRSSAAYVTRSLDWIQRCAPPPTWTWGASPACGVRLLTGGARALG